MSKLLEIHQRLRAIHDESIDASMAAALPTADPVAARLIGQHLLECGHPEAALSLVLNYHVLPREVQAAVVAASDTLYHALRQASQGRSGAGPVNASQIVRRTRSPRLAHLLADQLRFGDAEVRPLAAEGLLEIARVIAASPTHDAEAEQAFIASLEEAVNLYRHHGQPAVLLAVAAMVPRPMPGLFRLIQDRSHPAAEPMVRLIEASGAAEIRGALLAWLRLPPMMETAAHRLQRVEINSLAEPLKLAHLLPIGAVSRGLRRLREPQWLCPSTEQAAALPDAARRALPRWVRALPLDLSAQVEALAKWVRSDDLPLRLATFRSLLAVADQPGGETAHAVLSAFAEDPDLRLARTALRHLIRIRWSGLPKLLVKLINSPHEEIRHLAGGHLAPLGFSGFWDSWPRLSFAQQLAGGQALIKLDAGFPRLIGERLARPDRASRLRALAMIHNLNQGPIFEGPLIALAHDGDEIIASAAARALASCNTRPSIEALEKLLRHKDSRVRANAVESLQHLQSTRHVDHLREMATQEENRPRANAIAALLDMRTGEALTALARMLADQRPAQRDSALWLVDHLGLVELSRHVAEMSITDGDEKIKRRAAEVIQHLITALRAQGAAAPANQGAA